MKIESSKTLVGKGRHTHLARNKKSGFITRIMLAGMEWAGHTKKDHAASAGQRNLRDEKPDNNGHGLICAIGRPAAGISPTILHFTLQILCFKNI
jgi:hypothetical protein